MAFQQHSSFTPNNTQSNFAAHLSNQQTTLDREETSAASMTTFGVPHEWQDISLDTKHDDDSAHDMRLASGPAMNSSFKNEPAWSPVEASTNFNQSGDYDTLMPEYSVHTGPALGIPYDHNGQQAHSGSSASTTSTAIAAMQQTAHFDVPNQSQNWVPASGTENFDFSPLAPQGTRHTPVFATSTSILRRDGIRKKNARFEIPAERNLRTIDHLISQTTDETEIKELKQQKRLLRNRQAALDSRQRKKQHTERLEEEKKQFTNLLTDLEEELGAMKLRESDWIRQRDELLQSNSRMHQWCQQLQAEKEDSLRAHTIETGQLRKENSLLLEQLQRVDAVGCNAPESTSFSADYADFEQLTLQNQPWSDFNMQPNYSLGAHSSENINTETELQDAHRAHLANRKDDKTPTSGILLMLLLCGAWIISSESSKDLKMFPSAIPEELRTASATFIQDLYKNSGIQLPGNVDGRPAEPQNSEMVQIPRTAFGTSLDEGIISKNSLDETRNSPSMPVSSSSLNPGAMHSPKSSQATSRMSQILQEAVRSARAAGSQSSSPSELQTRSTLIDRVPKNVLEDFAQMVSHKRSGSGVSLLSRSAQDTYE